MEERKKEKREKKNKKRIWSNVCKSCALLIDVARQLVNVSKRQGKWILHRQVF